ncbi:hypothetical protein PREVCOP_03728 [Segatella copri DSM 18205]|uniref:Uncharacterized protein n=1 Tax=Segatella copri DSM 18205 TaxID=537011 RepID=D1P971_9BACT|nr:hypothetical protein PREVCOP_03728 [Segatella copri DSM 18205]
MQRYTFSFNLKKIKAKRLRNIVDFFQKVRNMACFYVFVK